MFQSFVKFKLVTMLPAQIFDNTDSSVQDIAPSLFAHFHVCFCIRNMCRQESLMPVLCMWTLANSVTKPSLPAELSALRQCIL